MAEKFGGDSHSSEIGLDIEEIGRPENNRQNVSDIRKKYERKLAANQGNSTEVCIFFTIGS